MSWNFVRMLIIIISRSSLKLGHVGLKTRSLDQQATQVSNLGPLWPSCFRKRWFFSWNISSWCMPQLERFLNIWNFFYSYVQDIQSSVSSTFLRYLRLLNALEGTLFWKKMIFSWNISSWCMPKFDRFLIIWNEFYSYVQGKKHLVSSTILSICDSLMPCMVHFFFWKKKMIFHELFQVCACPNLKNSLLYDRFSIHMYKARSIGYLQHAPTWKIPYYMTGFILYVLDEILNLIESVSEGFLSYFFYSYVQGKKHSVSSTIFLYLRLSYALYGIFFGKRWFFMKYFKLVQAPTWKIPYYMTGFLSICTRHKAFGIFNNFPLSATPSYQVRYIFLEKDEFLMKYLKLVQAPSWKIPQYMKIYLFICTRHREFGIFNFFALSATP